MDQFGFHPILAGLPVLDEVVKRLEKDAKAAQGGQRADKKELHEDNAETWEAFVADIKKRGIQKPLVCVRDEAGKLLIIDGRHRYNGAKQADLKDAPWELYLGDPNGYIMASVCHRYHWTKQQRAFFALHLQPHLVESKQGKRTDMELSESLGKLSGPQLTTFDHQFTSRTELAASIGVSADTVDIAARVHALFAKDKAARIKYLPMVFAGVSLSGILSGDGASKSDPKAGGANRKDPWVRIRTKWEKDAAAIKEDWEAVAAAGPEQQAEVKEALTAYLLALPEALLEHAQHYFSEDAS